MYIAHSMFLKPLLREFRFALGRDSIRACDAQHKVSGLGDEFKNARAHVAGPCQDLF